jgi:hypothetical protein
MAGQREIDKYILPMIERIDKNVSGLTDKFDTFSDEVSLQIKEHETRIRDIETGKLTKAVRDQSAKDNRSKIMFVIGLILAALAVVRTFWMYFGL